MPSWWGQPIILNPAVGWVVRCVTWDGTTGDCGSGGVESNGRFELAAVQVMAQSFTEDAVPPPERVPRHDLVLGIR
jgi:hypothetical protein